MRRLLVLVLVAGAAWTSSGSTPAAACSCAAPVAPPSEVFDAVAVDGAVAQGGAATAWTFAVTEVAAGDLDVDAEVLVQVAGTSSSCGVGVEVEASATYRLAVDPPVDGGPRHVNLCAGSIELVAGPDASALPSTGDGGGGGGGGPPWGLLAGVGVGLLVLGGVAAAAWPARA